MDVIRDSVADLVEAWFGPHASLCSGAAQVRIEALKSAAWTSVCCWPNSTLREYLLPARFLVLFFMLDDAPRDDLDKFIRSLRRGQCEGEPSPALVDLYSDLLTGLDVGEGAVRYAQFHDSVIDMCEGMLSERYANAALIDEEQMFVMRRRSVAVEPFLNAWLVAKRIEIVEPQDAEVRMAARLRHLAIDLIILANDLAGVEKDQAHSVVDPAGVDPNLVLIRNRELQSMQLAVESVVRMYNVYIDAFKKEEKRLFNSSQRPGVTRLVLEYVQLLKNNIDGNVEGHRRLVEIRYPGANERLSALSSVY
jgi:hypothetical protein